MKKIVSFFLCIVLILTFSVSAFAAEGGGLICPTCGSAVIVHSDTIEGIYHNIEYVCSNKDCDYKRKEKKILGMESISGATATPIEGVTVPPSGYINDNGTPHIGSSGDLYVAMEHDYIGIENSFINIFYNFCEHYDGHRTSSDKLSPTYTCRDDYLELRVSTPSYSFYPSLHVGYKLVAPIDGYYSFFSGSQYSTVCNSDINKSFEYSGEFTASLKDQLYGKDAVIKLQNDYDTYARSSSGARESSFFRATISGPVILQVKPLDPVYKQQTNITINNNTWNGSIYIDNSNKLTYIYPQYTVNNEIKINNNPIIYNEETKQYYTYDSVTNNYYYITYGDPAPTPTPSPSPEPGGSTPDPDKPSPTPTPGGSDSSDGGSVINPFKWLADLLKDIVEGIFKAVWKLTTSIFGFLIWLVGLLGNVLPFLPSEGLAALSAAAIIITVIRIIKFILGR